MSMETKERPFTKAIKTLKEKLKTLAVLQKKNKLACKTVKIDPEVKKKLLEELGIKYPEWARGYVVARKIEITAALNLYLELRGKTYRHNAPEGFWKSDYEKAMKDLREVLKV
jgi:hypothetical protein